MLDSFLAALIAWLPAIYVIGASLMLAFVGSAVAHGGGLNGLIAHLEDKGAYSVSRLRVAVILSVIVALIVAAWPLYLGIKVLRALLRPARSAA